MDTIVKVGQLRSMVTRRLGRLVDAVADALPSDEFKFGTDRRPHGLDGRRRLPRGSHPPWPPRRGPGHLRGRGGRQSVDGWIHTNMFR